MNELALFSGMGGSTLAGLLAGWTTIGAVEIDPYCREILLRRQEEGLIEPFPIWDDIRTFDGKPWRGAVDIVTGGFPCQPFSTAKRGRRAATDLSGETLRVVKEVRPRFVFMENVIGSRGIWPAIIGQLESMGFDVRGPISLGPSDLGGTDDGQRYWVFATANGDGQPTVSFNAEVAELPKACGCDWWRSDPRVLGMANGLSYRMERLRACGNAWVPLVAAVAWRELFGRINASE